MVAAIRYKARHATEKKELVSEDTENKRSLISKRHCVRGVIPANESALQGTDLSHLPSISQAHIHVRASRTSGARRNVKQNA